jgi:hypothetical protein
MHALLILLLAFLSANSRLGENPRDASGLPVACSVSDERPLDSCGSCASATAECLVAASSNTLAGLCFFAGTPVVVEGGYRPIELIQAGDRVWSCDRVTGEWYLSRVAETYVNEYVGDQIATLVAGEWIKSTYHHPYWVVRGKNLEERPKPDHVAAAIAEGGAITGRWVDAGDLVVGDILLLRDGRQMPVEAIESTCAFDKVYNFAVEPAHNYAVGHAGILVHNNCAAGGNAGRFAGLSNNALNKTINAEQHVLLRQLFKGQNPAGLARETLEAAAELSRRALANSVTSAAQREVHLLRLQQIEQLLSNL